MEPPREPPKVIRAPAPVRQTVTQNLPSINPYKPANQIISNV